MASLSAAAELPRRPSDHFNNQNPIRFIDHFWGERNRGFDELILNFKKSHQSIDEFHKFVIESANVQTQLSRLFGRLSSQLSKFNSTTCFFPMTQLLRTLIDDVANVHVRICEDYQILAEQVSNYNSQKKDRQRNVKESESRTAELIAILNSTGAAITKVKAQYEMHLSEFRKLTANTNGTANGAHSKALDRTEKKLKYAGDEYRSLVGKYNEARDEFESKFGDTCNNFQDIEERHLTQMKTFALIYSDSMQTLADGIRDARLKFVLDSDQLSLDDMLKEFIENRATGTSRPNPAVFDEDLPTPAFAEPPKRENVLDRLFTAREHKKAIAGSLIASTPSSPVVNDHSGIRNNGTAPNSVGDPFFHSLFLGFFKTKEPNGNTNNGSSGIVSMSSLRRKHRLGRSLKSNRGSSLVRDSGANTAEAEAIAPSSPDQKQRPSTPSPPPESIQSSYSLIRNRASSTDSSKLASSEIDNWPIHGRGSSEDLSPRQSRTRTSSQVSSSSSTEDIGGRLNFTIKPALTTTQPLPLFRLAQPPRSKLSRPSTAAVISQEDRFFDPYRKRSKSALPSRFPMQFDENNFRGRNPSELTLCPENDETQIDDSNSEFDWDFSRCASRSISICSELEPSPTPPTIPFIEMAIGYLHTITTANKQCVTVCLSFRHSIANEIVRQNWLLNRPNPVRLSLKNCYGLSRVLINQNILSPMDSSSNYELNAMAIERKLRHKLKMAKASNVLVELVKYEIESVTDHHRDLCLLIVDDFKLRFQTCLYPLMKKNRYSGRCGVCVHLKTQNHLEPNNSDLCELDNGHFLWVIREMSELNDKPGWFGAEINLPNDCCFDNCWLELDCDVDEREKRLDCAHPKQQQTTLLRDLEIVFDQEAKHEIKITTQRFKVKGKINLDIE